MSQRGDEFDFIVVGSGAGGGPLAANLATRGFRVLLLEAGSGIENDRYRVPGFHGLASEDPELRWDYWVHHYADRAREKLDSKFDREEGGVLYPRAGTLGGCTAHNAMITMQPHDSDWDAIADLTGDRSWLAGNMQRYFERLECCGYVGAPGSPAKNLLERISRALQRLRRWGRPAGNPSGHGYEGWLSTSLADPTLALPDKELLKLLWRGVAQAVRRGSSFPRSSWRLPCLRAGCGISIPTISASGAARRGSASRRWRPAVAGATVPASTYCGWRRNIPAISWSAPIVWSRECC
jgi:choline dehydrogenase